MNISVAEYTLTGRIVYENGNHIPFSITIGDNCCEGHAEGTAANMVNAYVDQRNESERKLYPRDPELCNVEFDNRR